jgi:type I restriction enzyme S subunit
LNYPAIKQTTGIQNLDSAAYLDTRVGLPPEPEQRAIADFLDRETAKIDTLVAKKRLLIERLKEKRTALISRTVTCGLPPDAARAAGLDPHPKLKSSGIDWLGDVPEHWQVRRLKDAGELCGGAGFPHEYQGVSGEELPFYKVGDLALAPDGRTLGDAAHSISKDTAAELRARVIPQGAVVYAKIGAALFLNRRRITPAPCCIDNNMTAFIPRLSRLTSEWTFYWMSTLNFGEFANPGAVPSLSEGYQATLPLLLPELDEQAAIVDFLDGATARIDSMVAKVETAIERLQEYRTALITAAVTGKIDVRREINGG